MAACPKCGSPQEEAAETCPRCGVVFAKVKPTAAPHPWLGRFEYKMVQIAPTVLIEAEKRKGNDDEVGAYLERIVNALAYEGWEFLRIDEMRFVVSEEALFGTRSESRPTALYVATFRRERQR